MEMRPFKKKWSHCYIRTKANCDCSLVIFSRQKRVLKILPGAFVSWPYVCQHIIYIYIHFAHFRVKYRNKNFVHSVKWWERKFQKKYAKKK